MSFVGDLWLSAATIADWPYFARWHYRSRRFGPVRWITLLWHADQPIGICVCTAPPMSLAARNRFFGCSGRWTRTSLRTMNGQLVMLSRVVLRPAYRGAGLAAQFVRRSCELCPYPWIEILTEMGHVNPIFERAGFTRVEAVDAARQSRAEYSEVYGGRRAPDAQKLISEETWRKTRYARPVYYVFDNRRRTVAGRARGG